MKNVFKMSAYELVQHEASQGQKHSTTDLETALADKLTEAVWLLMMATAQLQDHSDKGVVTSSFGDVTIDELKAFCGVAG